MTPTTPPTTETAPPGALTGRAAAAWLATFAGFPLGGVAAGLVAGPVDDPVAAVLGGLAAGAVLGAVQAWALGRSRPPALAWVLATALGLAAGLAAGAAIAGYGSGMADLVAQGAVCGAAVGLAQAAVLARRIGPLAAVWPPLLSAAWAAGWAVTTAIGVDVEKHYAVFGSSGAITVAALTLVLPVLLRRAAR